MNRNPSFLKLLVLNSLISSTSSTNTCRQVSPFFFFYLSVALESWIGTAFHNCGILWTNIELSWFLFVIKVALQVQGIVQDKHGKTVATLIGKWDESMHYVIGDFSGKGKELDSLLETRPLLWKRSKPSKYPTRYNLTRFGITLNELTSGLKVMVVYLVILLLPHHLILSPLPPIFPFVSEVRNQASSLLTSN